MHSQQLVCIFFLLLLLSDNFLSCAGCKRTSCRKHFDISMHEDMKSV